MTAARPVVVVGAGGAGLAAALSAADGGANVVAIEANPHFRGGCTTVLSSGLVPGAGTSQQAQHGIEDRPEYLAEDVLHRAGGDAPTDVVHALATASAPLVGWLSHVLGRQLELAIDAHYPGHRVPRLHGLPERSGAALHRAMLAAVERRAHIDLAVPFRLIGLEEDGTDWRVIVEDPGGTTTTLSARAVVLANAGFAQAPDLLAEHLPALAGIAYHGGDGNDGGALRIGASLGLETAYLDSFTAHASFAPEHGVLVTWNVVMQGGVIVDRSGHRFADESRGYSGFAERVADRPGGCGSVLLDDRIAQSCTAFPEFRALLDAGGVRWAQDMEALAALLDVDPAVIAATMASVIDAASGERPDPHGRSEWAGVLEWPIGVIPIVPILGMTQGGLLTDATGRVRRNGRSLGGLYAAGGAAAGISGHGGEGYMAGNGLLMALGLGYLAGRHAAQATNGDAHGEVRRW